MTDPLAHVPGSSGLPVLGETVPWLRDARAFVDARRGRGDVVRSRLLGRDMILLFGADEAREVLLDRDRIWSSHGGWQRTIGTLFRRGLMLRDFEDHRTHRRIMSVAFRRESLDGYAGLIDEVVQRRLAPLAPGRIDAYGLLKSTTLDIANEVFLGVSLQDRADAVTRAFVDLVAASITPVRAPLPGTPMARGLAGRRLLEAELAPVVSRERARPPTRTLVSQLCHAVDDDGRGFDDTEIVDHLIFLLMAAHDTSTSTLTVMLAMLADRPEWQDRCRRETKALAGAVVDLDAGRRMPATELLFKEATRLHPPVPFIPRRATRDTELGGHAIPAGTLVSAVPLAIHRDPRWFTAPERVDPDRFGEARAEHRSHSHCFIPFGGGAHQCIGNHLSLLEIKAILARLLPAWRVETAGTGLDLQPIPIPKPRGGRHDLVLTPA
ncbi:MAG: cytochrome P450 [Kineosporiaceae bacterium]